ncbi:MAG: hypothetical protein WAW11_03655 [Patescibacteria group bacterium]
MEREKQLKNCFILEWFFKSFLISFFIFLMSLIGGNTINMLVLFIIVSIIFIPGGIVKYNKEKNKGLVLNDMVLTYYHGYLVKNSLDIPINTIKFIKIEEDIFYGFFNTAKIIIIFNTPVSVQMNKGVTNISNSEKVSYMTLKKEADSLRMALNARN